jgi:hypothetical protein
MIRPYIQVTNTLTARTQRLCKSYRKIILDEITDYLDNVRKDAVSEIIPAKNPSNRSGFVRMYREQPSTPGKLTERTGSLIRMLKDLSSWNRTKSRSRSMSGDAMQGNVAVTTAGTVIAEQYYGSLSVNIRSESRYWPYNRGKAGTYPTKQQLFFRFMWETGIRGEKRQFLEPAAKRQQVFTERIVEQKLNHLEKIGVIQYV